VALKTVRIGSLDVTRLVIGGNPFSGFSHQGPARDKEMRRYYTVDRIKRTLRKAEEAGINTFFGRADNHVIRMLEEYWAEGGRIQWFAQTASEIDDYVRNISTAAANGAKAVYLHGGVADFYINKQQTEHFDKALCQARKLGLPGGLAGHKLETHCWARDHLSPDFELVCYYDPIPREDDPHHKAGDYEVFDPAHRDALVKLIPGMKWPVVHYKVLAGGRTPAKEAFAYAAKHVRPQDIVLVGFHLGDDEDIIAKTVDLFNKTIG